MPLIKTKFCWNTALSRGVLFIVLWCVLTEGTLSSWWIGVPVVLFSVAVSITLIPSAPLLWFEVLKFTPVFLLYSILGAIDVARRVFQPALPIAPDIIEYPVRLPSGLPLILMANIVCLLPGTLSVAFEQKIMRVHVLDKNKEFMEELRMVEENVAKFFGHIL